MRMSFRTTMRSNPAEKVLSGESAPLMARGHSGFRLHDDTHVLTTKVSPGSNKATTSQEHKRTGSDWTWLSGNLTKRKGDSPQAMPDIFKTRKRRGKFMTKMLIGSCYLLALLYTCTILIGPLVLSFQDESEWCSKDDNEQELKRSGDPSPTTFSWEMNIEDKEYENPDYITDPCRYIRVPQLAWLTLEECDLSRRMLTSVILGGAIGYERRTSDRPAGIRTMGLVSLGACFFTISSMMAFKSSTMGWDASRVTAALPSGVGFLGAALIWKGSVVEGDEETHQVHGLTTAASLWLSAAIGVGAGGAMYVVSIYSTVLILLVLRYGPKFLWLHDDESEEGDNEDEEEDTAEADADAKTGSFRQEEFLHSAQNSIHTTHSLGTQDSAPRPERRVVFEEVGFPQSLTAEDTPSLVSTRSAYFEGSLGSGRQSMEVSVSSPRRPSSIKRRRSSIHVNRPTFHG